MSFSPKDVLRMKMEAFHFLYRSARPCGQTERDSTLDQLRRLRNQVEELYQFPDIRQEAGGLVAEIDSAIKDVESARNWPPEARSCFRFV